MGLNYKFWMLDFGRVLIGNTTNSTKLNLDWRLEGAQALDSRQWALCVWSGVRCTSFPPSFFHSIENSHFKLQSLNVRVRVAVVRSFGRQMKMNL